MPCSLSARLPGRWGLVAVAILAAGVGQAAAQDGFGRVDLAAFRDSVASLDSASLRAVESRLMLAARRQRTDPVTHIRLGVVAERLGLFSDAAAEFKWATQLASRWPAAWLAWGEAELELGDEIEKARTTRRLNLARDAWPRAEMAFARAAELDTAYVSVLVDLAQRSFAAGRADRARVVRGGLRRAAARPDASAVTVLALGRVERLTGDTAAAVAAFERAANLPGGRGPGLLERARTELTQGREQGIEAWFAGIAVDDSAALAGFEADLTYLAPPQELDRLLGVPGEDRARRLWRFWTDRDRAALRRNGERLIEHYRRLAAARAAYPSLDDARARVLIRHGEPTSRATLRLSVLAANESWWYPRPTGDMVVHFVARPDSTGYGMVDSIFDIAAAELEVGAPAGGDDDRRGVDVMRVVRSRAPLSPLYQAAAEGSPSQLAAFRERERVLAGRGRRLALTDDSHPIRFARDLAARVSFAGLFGDSTGPAMHLFFAVPGFAVRPVAEAPHATYQIHVRLVVRDTSGAAVRALDSVVVVARERPANDDEVVAGVTSIPLPPGRYEVTAALQSAGAGTYATAQTVAVPARSPSALTLSDVVLGGRRPALSWRKPGGSESIDIDPVPVLSRSDTLAAYAELSGRQGTVSGRIRVLIRPVKASGDAERWKPFPGQSEWVPLPADGPEVLPIRVRLPLRRLARGAYGLQLVVVDGSGSTVWGESRFEVEDRAR